MAFFTYPSGELGFGLTPALVDSKSRVWHDDMEMFAVLASSTGPSKTIPLFKSVDAVELEDNRDRVIHVEQVRLAGQTLLKLSGFVQHTVPLPSSGHDRGPVYPLEQIQTGC
ncbi:hypothetical protein BTVI_31089 [Pitangus sulphuratus]|nr:hypothetical protein BTVI_31089 [Pitangus sulphuratus]